jgi:hypothetical protein
MAKFKKEENIWNGVKHHYTQYLYMCPGCKCMHTIALKSEGGNHDFNMNLDRPTVSPSVLYSSHPVCHSFIKDGMIQFLSDCEHELAGQTVELPEIE